MGLLKIYIWLTQNETIPKWMLILGKRPNFNFTILWDHIEALQEPLDCYNIGWVIIDTCSFRWFFLTSGLWPRLVLKSVLEGAYGKVLVTLGVCCSSWVVASRGSTKRSFLTPVGCLEFPSVASANLMVSRPVVPKFIYH